MYLLNNLLSVRIFSCGVCQLIRLLKSVNWFESVSPLTSIYISCCICIRKEKGDFYKETLSPTL